MQNYQIIAISMIALAILPVAHGKPTSHKQKAKPVAAKPKVNPNYTFIKQAYDYQSNGFPARDVNIVCSYMTDDFIIVSAHGVEVDKKGYMDVLYRMFNTVEHEYPGLTLTRVITIQKIRLSPTTAVVDRSSQFSATIAGHTQDKAPSTGTDQGGLFEDTWIRTMTGWMLQKIVVLQE